MEDLIYCMLQYYRNLKTEHEKEAFTIHMAENLKKYILTNERINRDQERGFEKLRKIVKGKNDEEFL